MYDGDNIWEKDDSNFVQNKSRFTVKFRKMHLHFLLNSVMASLLFFDELDIVHEHFL